MIPNNKVGSAATLDIVRTMSTRTLMQNSSSHFVIVGMGMLSMIGCPKHAAERERGTLKFFAQANVKRDITIVRMHVEPKILVGPVANNEAVMVVKLGSLLWKETTTDGPQIVLLKGRDQWSHADFIHNHSVIVHTVGPSDWDIFSFGNVVEIIDFFVKNLYEGVVKHIKGVDAIHFFFQHIWDNFIRVHITGSLRKGIRDFYKVLVKPGTIELALKELRVQTKRHIEWFCSGRHHLSLEGFLDSSYK
mmetsp:Transcript_16474/g.30896  ORF Transcript_16474/g.30896 Transcript_16474/m.30896 type:complete len:248 (+) Transcript_16474:397-1140(+)